MCNTTSHHVVIDEWEARQLIVLHGDSAFVCIHVSNATGMQLLQTVSCGRGIACTCSASEGEHALRRTRMQRGGGD